MPDRPAISAAVAPALDAVGRFGDWVQRRSYWAVFAAAVVVMVIKNGFRWAGTTGEGWYIQFHSVIEAWPLKEPLGADDSSAWQENYAPILAFRALTTIGFPHSSATWNLVHILASAGVLVFLGVRLRGIYGTEWGRLVMLLVLFGAAPMVLLHEIGRYDSFFLLGAVLLAIGSRWWTQVAGALLVGMASWSMGIALVLGLVLVGLVLRSRSVIVRGVLGVAGCALAMLFLMGLRLAQGGDPWLVRLGKLAPVDTGEPKRPADMLYQVWLNTVNTFPNWIYAAFGVTWILVVLVLIQARTHRLLLAIAAASLPVLAGMTNANDGTREIAMSLAAILLAVAATLQIRSREGGDAAPTPPSGLLMGAVVVVCLVAPVVNISPGAPINPYEWLGDYGLSILYSIFG